MFKFCPQCGSALVPREDEGITRNACPDQACGFVHWDNPTPVVAAVVEHEGHIILARNRAWTVPFYALITGFLEKTDPSASDAAMREVEEELGLSPQGANFIGHYSFHRKNQIIIAYHVPATGEVRLNEELSDYRRIEPAKARYWPAATGLALRDWLISQGHTPEAMELPKL